MKINWKVRAVNPYFWIGLIAVVLASVGVSPESLTSWAILKDQLLALIRNPFAIGCVAIAVIGYVIDPTTRGIGDSERVLSYKEPR